ncbi:hypothetical protein HMPREF9442_00999 [Paraprevotella xylaniphila YIT 11841]|uniref:Uncharacterized protein n=1 Tax=Paraprevotella xylaniphila YIT 11841 TaxID=762982 RepID=F3QS44_9BACT|nr:hypothetical protein HMPREF9442_00999 [Paraprevotella xylaniphila YIT 11841]
MKIPFFEGRGVIVWKDAILACLARTFVSVVRLFEGTFGIMEGNIVRSLVKDA